jgi:hypothetical protein
MSNDHLSQSPLDDIVAELNQTTALDRSTILRWMQTNDIEAMGALMDLLGEKVHQQRVQPPLAFDDIYPFVKNYYERSLSENPDGEWSDSRTTAGWNFAKWFIQLWEDDSVSRNVLSDLKAMLEKLCRKGGPDLCYALTTAVLEHLFQRAEIKAYFVDWQPDPLLRLAYDEASHLANVARQRRDKA